MQEALFPGPYATRCCELFDIVPFYDIAHTFLCYLAVSALVPHLFTTLHFEELLRVRVDLQHFQYDCCGEKLLLVDSYFFLDVRCISHHQ